MPGLIQRNMRPPLPAAPQGQAPASQQGQQPAAQQSVQRVVIAATRIMHDPKIKPRLLEMMQQAGDPVQALVEVVFLIMRQIMEKAGRQIPSEVLGTAAFTVLHLVGELAQAAGLFQVTPKLLQQAAQAGLERLKQEGGAQQQQAAAPPPQPAAPAAQPVTAGGY